MVRVIRISRDGQSAVLRNLITHNITEWPLRQAHIRDIRFILPPCDKYQHQLWEEVIATKYFKDVRDMQIRRQFLNEFWEKVEEKDDEEENKKRARGE